MCQKDKVNCYDSRGTFWDILTRYLAAGIMLSNKRSPSVKIYLHFSLDSSYDNKDLLFLR